MHKLENILKRKCCKIKKEKLHAIKKNYCRLIYQDINCGKKIQPELSIESSWVIKQILSTSYSAPRHISNYPTQYANHRHFFGL
jgi:hypothetical protein